MTGTSDAAKTKELKHKALGGHEDSALGYIIWQIGDFCDTYEKARTFWDELYKELGHAAGSLDPNRPFKALAQTIPREKE